MNSEHATTHASLRTYTVGFLLSVALTFMAYGSVVYKLLSGNALIAFIVFLAIAQLLVQLVYFLHLGQEAKPKQNLMVFLFAAMVICILVFGSLWIMNSLDYHMTSNQVNEYIIKEEGIKP